MCTDNKEFPSGKYSDYGNHVLAATKVFKTGLLDYFLLFKPNLTSLLGNKKDAFYSEYNNSPYKDVRFYHVFCFYCLGYERNGVKLSTTSDYVIYPRSPTRFDFNKGMAQLNEDDSKFGHFEFSALHGSEGRWKEISKGVYDYYPNGDILDLDEFIVDYIDTTRISAVTKCWGKLRLKLMDDKLPLKRYLLKKSFKNVTDAYRNIQGIDPNASVLVYGFVSPTVSLGAFVSTTNGSFIPKES